MQKCQRLVRIADLTLLDVIYTSGQMLTNIGILTAYYLKQMKTKNTSLVKVVGLVKQNAQKGETMSDLISKTEALIKIRGCYPSLPIFKKNRKAWQEKYEGYIKAYEIIKDLPTAEPKTGEWVEVNSYESEHHSVTDMRCNICGKYSSVVLPHKTRFTYPYCPFCGAKMERSKE